MNLTITHNVYLHNGDSKFESQVLSLLQAILAKEEKIMATEADIEQSIKDINTATDTVAAEIAALQAQIVPGVVTQAQADSINASLGGIVARLNSIGNPTAPAGNVPPTAPTTPAA
jgi:hypothetical protein